MDKKHQLKFTVAFNMFGARVQYIRRATVTSQPIEHKRAVQTL